MRRCAEQIEKLLQNVLVLLLNLIAEIMLDYYKTHQQIRICNLEANSDQVTGWQSIADCQLL